MAFADNPGELSNGVASQDTQRRGGCSIPDSGGAVLCASAHRPLFDAGRQENDVEKRRAIYQKLDARLDAVAPAIFASEVTGVFIGLNTFHLPPGPGPLPLRSTY